jgi:hypothetical protein
MKQPDFRGIFFDYFGKEPRKVTYTVRKDSNRYHDFVFLMSLIHDANFKISETRLHRKRLTFSLSRLCWELRTVANDEKFSKLCITKSKLTFFPVESVEWKLPHDWVSEEFQTDIEDLWLDRAEYSDTPRIVLDGYMWSCSIRLSNRDFTLRLEDLEIPHIPSQEDPI